MTDQVTDQEFEVEEFEEAHDPKNAEEASIASVAAADDAAPKAKPRKGDKAGGDKMEKAPTKAVANEDVDLTVDFSADIDALVEGEATLSEEFKEKTAVIFEAALKSKLAEEVNALEEAYAVELAEEVEAHKADLVEKVDSYLNYVVENWMEENRIAIETGLRAEIAEDFMGKLKDLFTESYIEVPESKVDLVDELADEVESLEEQLNSTTADAMALAEELVSYKRAAVIAEAKAGMVDTHAEKLEGLVEGIEFEGEEEFAAKVATIKESYFTKTSTSSAEALTEDTHTFEADTTEEVSDVMAQYLSAIKRTSK